MGAARKARHKQIVTVDEAEKIRVCFIITCSENRRVNGSLDSIQVPLSSNCVKLYMCVLKKAVGVTENRCETVLTCC
jgi:hypothetical protein